MSDAIEFLKIIDTPLGTAVLLIIIGYFWFKEQLRPIKELRKSLAQIQANLDGQAKVQQAILTILGRANLMQSEDFDVILRASNDVISRVIQTEMISKNPLTAEQVQDLKVLYDKLKHGDTLSVIEAQRFLQYAQIMSKERPNETGTADLLALASLALGYATGARGSRDITKGMSPPALPELGDDETREGDSQEPSSENPSSRE